MATAIDDTTTAGLQRWSLLEFATPATDTTWGESEFLSFVQDAYSMPTLTRDKIRLLEIRVWGYDGMPKVKRSALYPDDYYVPVNQADDSFFVPDRMLASEIECPVFLIDTASSIILEFSIRIVP